MLDAAFGLENVFKSISSQPSALVKETSPPLSGGLPQTLLRLQELISAGKLNQCWIV